MEWMEFDKVEPISPTRILMELLAFNLSTPEKRLTGDDLVPGAGVTFEDSDPEAAQQASDEEAMERSMRLLRQAMEANARLGGINLREEIDL